MQGWDSAERGSERGGENERERMRHWERGKKRKKMKSEQKELNITEKKWYLWQRYNRMEM